AGLSLDPDFRPATVTSFDRAAIDRVHDPRMVDWLEEAWVECRPFSEQREIIPDVYRHTETVIPGRPSREPFHHPMARLGYYSFDSMTPLVEGTYEASRSAVDVALSALEHVLDAGTGTGTGTGTGVAYGLCRPPGHHASSGMIGGYCFFNNAAVVAAEMARRSGGP